MSNNAQIKSLSQLEFLPYLEENGTISEQFQNKIGVYAIFDQDKILQFVGYSRDVYLSLKQHLVRKPQECYWVKIETITRPNRTILEEIRQTWLQENGDLPLGNSTEEALWSQPIDAKTAMTEKEKQAYQQGAELEKIKLLKQIARRVESQIQEELKNRGVTMEIRFNPKLKEEGLLDLKP